MASSSKSWTLLCLALLATTAICSEAREFLVGGSHGAWRVPPTSADSLNQWAEKNRFQVGDSLVWKYDPAKDSVLQVTREAYLSCNRTSPVVEHKDGNTTVELRRPGAYYFISGAGGACEQGEKFIVVVMSVRHPLRGFAPAPAPTEYEGPAIAPTTGAAAADARIEALMLRSGALVALAVLYECIK